MRIPAALFCLLTLLISAPIEAGVYSTKEGALARAFPGADRVETVNLFLTEDEMARVRKASGVALESAIASFYVGRRGEEILGYAAIEAGTVRTLPETVMVVLAPDGAVRFAEILAFFEPTEYMPPKRWLDQFEGKVLSPKLRIGDEIQSISGATLSAQAITRQVRKSAALCALLIGRR